MTDSLFPARNGLSRILRPLMMSLFTTCLVCLSAIHFQAKAQPVVPPASSTAVEASHVFCQTDCTLWSATVTSAASAGLLMIDNATAAPLDGAVTPIYCIAVPVGSTVNLTFPNGARFNTGATFVFSTGTNCASQTSSSTAFFTAQVTP